MADIPNQDDQHRIALLEQNQQQLVDEIQRLSQHISAASSFPSPSPHPNLKLPQPPPFSGLATELPEFKMKLSQFLRGSPHTYSTSESQLLYAGSLLTGSASQWYRAHVDSTTFLLPSSYTLDRFFQELEDFFGGAVTLQTRERALKALRQTGSVSDLAIAFQNITHTFSPLWPDHPLIFIFSDKLREGIRFELTARGSIPTTFQAYLTAAISVEQNQAAAALSRTPSSSQPPPRPPFVPKSLPLASPQPAPSPSQPTPMDLDGSRGPRGSLTDDERRRRSDAGLCAYCGRPGHDLATCQAAARGRQIRGTYQPVPGSPYPPAGYPFPPAFQYTPFHGPYPGPWTAVPPPQPQLASSAMPKNGPPSQ